MLGLKLIHVSKKGHWELLIIKCLGMDGVECLNNEIIVAVNRLVI